MTSINKIVFLRARGAHTANHSSGNLLEHLIGTSELLRSWGARAALCDAGLFHSVYGTDAYATTLLTGELRPRVRELIGSDAEELAYLFCRMRRQALFDNLSRPAPFQVQCRWTGEAILLSEAQFADVCCLTAANLLEQWPRLTEPVRFGRREGYRAMRRWLPAAARAALNRAFDFAEPSSHLSSLLRWESEGDVGEACNAANAAHLKRVAGGLNSFHARGPERQAVLARLNALPDDAYLRIVAAPETHFQLLAAEEDGTENLLGYVDGAVEIERARVESGVTPANGGWSALGDLYVPKDARTAPVCGLDEPRADATFEAPSLLDEFVLDLWSPYSARELDAGEYRLFTYSPAQPFAREERALVYERMTRAMRGIRAANGVTYAFVAANVRTIMPRKQTYHDVYRGSSNRRTIGRVNVFNPHLEAIDETHIAQSFVHEATHQFLFKIEEDLPTIADPEIDSYATGPRVSSPWSGSVLPLVPMIHSATVWYALMNFFRNPAVARHFPSKHVSYYANRSVKGFVDRQLTRCLEPYRFHIRGEIFDELERMEALAIEAPAA